MKLDRDGIAVVVLAAGLGSRMGAVPKLLLTMSDGKSLLRHTVSSAMAWEPRALVVVLRPDLPELDDALHGLQVVTVENPRFREGMGTSLAAGIAALGPDVGAALVLLGDQPIVELGIVQRLVDEYRRASGPIVVPKYGDEIGPPTLFDRTTFGELKSLEGEAGGRQIMARHLDWVSEVHFDKAERPADIDTPADYRALIERAK